MRKKGTDGNSKDIDWEAVAKQVPRLNDVKEAKQTILGLLVKHRIYTDDDYAFLVCLIQSVNIHLDRKKIIELVG